MEINFSNDLGYGSVKGRLNGELVKVPSIMVRERPEDIGHAVKFNNKNDETKYIQDYLNHINVSINSQSISSNGQFLIGESANNSREQPQSFDVNNYSGKSKSDLSIAITLSVLAGQALKNYYQQYQQLPTQQINANVNMVTALPVVEGSRRGTLSNYANRYLQCNHTVTIRNFQNPIQVNIHFNHVLVRLEGQVAVYYIRHATPTLLNDISGDFSKHYPQLYQLVHSPSELTNVDNTLSIDIGEGTTDFVVFSNGRINFSASSSIQLGYGNILEAAVRELISKEVGVDSRATLKDILNQPVNWSNASIKKVCQQAIQDNVGQLINQITDELSESIRNAKGKIDIIYVYGGGAIPMASVLRAPLSAKTKTFRGGKEIPIVFIGSNLAQFMNVNGLEMILNALVQG